MKSSSDPQPPQTRSWQRLALILLGAAAILGLSGCYCYPGYGQGYGYGGGGYSHHSYGGYGGGYRGGYCPSY